MIADNRAARNRSAAELNHLACKLREVVLHQSKRANVGHIGSALSIVELLIALRASMRETLAPDDPDRDRLILSKGHAALALYGLHYLEGGLDEDQLNSFCGDGSLLGVHPSHELAGIDFSTGSLGHGLPVGAGSALAARLQQSERRVFVLLSDAELNEGSVWEAAMFAAHHRLSNLIAVVDANGQQAFGHTADVLNLGPLGDKWRACGWDVEEASGHDIERLIGALDRFDASSDGRPHVLVADTVFGCGVSYMERQVKWHYLPMSDEQYERALNEVQHSPGGVPGPSSVNVRRAARGDGAPASEELRGVQGPPPFKQ